MEDVGEIFSEYGIALKRIWIKDVKREKKS